MPHSELCPYLEQACTSGDPDTKVHLWAVPVASESAAGPATPGPPAEEESEYRGCAVALGGSVRAARSSLLLPLLVADGSFCRLMIKKLVLLVCVMRVLCDVVIATCVCSHLQAADMVEGPHKSKVLFKAGTVLVVVAYDGARSIVPLLVVHVPGTESAEAWKYALTCLKEWYGNTKLLRDPNSAFMADLGAGFLAAAREVMPHTPILSCGEHREVSCCRVIPVVLYSTSHC